MPDAQEVYTANVRPLPRTERLRVAALILEELTRPLPPTIDQSDEWSEEDIRDLTAYSLNYAATLYPEEGHYV